MRQRNYENERDILLNTYTPNAVPSRAFIREFLKRLANAKSNIKELSYGEALFGKRINAEVQYGALELEHWIQYYELKDEHDIPGMIRKLKEIHG